MKNLWLLFVLGILMPLSSQAQFDFGFKLGVHSLDLASDGIIVEDENSNDFELNIENANYGFHFGMFLRFQMDQLYIEPSITLNSNSVDYNIFESGQSSASTIFNEKYQNVDIPILIGYDMGLIRINGGPVGHFNINKSSDLIDFPSYEQKFETMTFGWQAGIGVDLLNVGFNLSYEGNFSRFGNQFVIGGQEFELDTDPSRILFTVEFRL